jgi:hypothetical protein
MEPVHLVIIVCVNLVIGVNTPMLGIYLIAYCGLPNCGRPVRRKFQVPDAVVCRNGTRFDLPGGLSANRLVDSRSAY